MDVVDLTWIENNVGIYFSIHFFLLLPSVSFNLNIKMYSCGIDRKCISETVQYKYNEREKNAHTHHPPSRYLSTRCFFVLYFILYLFLLLCEWCVCEYILCASVMRTKRERGEGDREKRAAA